MPCLIVAVWARVAYPHVGNLHVFVDLIPEVGDVGALLAPDFRQFLHVGVDLVPLQGARLRKQGSNFLPHKFCAAQIVLKDNYITEEEINSLCQKQATNLCSSRRILVRKTKFYIKISKLGESTQIIL